MSSIIAYHRAAIKTASINTVPDKGPKMIVVVVGIEVGLGPGDCVRWGSSSPA